MGFFSKLFKTTSGDIDSNKIDSLLEAADFLKGELPPRFYSRLIEIFTSSIFQKDNPQHAKVYKEFRDKVHELSSVYDSIISSGFDKDLLASFITKFKELTPKDEEFPLVNTLMVSYWYQPIRKTMEDINNSEDEELISTFEEFHSAIRIIMDEMVKQ